MLFVFSFLFLSFPASNFLRFKLTKETEKKGFVGRLCCLINYVLSILNAVVLQYTELQLNLYCKKRHLFMF